MQNELLIRIQQIIEEKCGKSEAAFAKKIGVGQSRLNRNLKSDDYKQLMGLTGWILSAYPEISREWLLTGAGETYRPEDAELVAGLELKIEHLRELLAGKDEIIASQKETIAAQKQMFRAPGPSVETIPKGAAGGATVAPSSRLKTDR